MSRKNEHIVTKKAKPLSVYQKFRSPCIDAHYEAFILQSTWTIGNLYSANLYLGQSYVKQIQDIEKQRKVWLSRKERERETMQKRFAALKKQELHRFRSDGQGVNEKKKYLPQRAITVAPSHQISKLDLFPRREHFKQNRTSCQPTRENARLQEIERRTISGILYTEDLSLPFSPSCGFTGYAKSEPQGDLSANCDLIPRWLPSNLRSKDVRGKI